MHKRNLKTHVYKQREILNLTKSLPSTIQNGKCEMKMKVALEKQLDRYYRF